MGTIPLECSLAVTAQQKMSPEDFYDAPGGPSFIGEIQNVTVKAGRDAVLNCVVKNLGEYKVSGPARSWALSFSRERTLAQLLWPRCPISW